MIRCPECNGNKLKSEILKYNVNRVNIGKVSELEIKEIISWCDVLEKQYSNSKLNRYINGIIEEIRKRLHSLVELKLEYLTNKCSIPSLSGGEMQRDLD